MPKSALAYKKASATKLRKAVVGGELSRAGVSQERVMAAATG